MRAHHHPKSLPAITRNTQLDGKTPDQAYFNQPLPDAVAA
jgi:hypothetical protein